MFILQQFNAYVHQNLQAHSCMYQSTCASRMQPQIGSAHYQCASSSDLMHQTKGVLFIDVQTCSLLMNPEPKGQLFFPKIPKGQLKIQTNQNSKGVDCLTSYYKHLWGHELSLLRHGGHHAQQGSTQPHAIADNFFFFLQGVKLPLGSGHPFNPCHKLFQCKIIIHSPHSVYNSGPKNQ